ncbi:hypothetical protein M569_07867 [Genlisea aurea]|uniref:Uncharacterized protein n=1 Tax=Genlisea aurea TaxID=192259 RepID=S8E3S9_9LAMI|nr:hypothetical protein M569_07867 [Genlisea aurea]
MVMEVVPEEDTGLCADHPYGNSNSGGGICAFCLQEKLGKLVSSSFPAASFPSSSSSSSSPSFRSEFAAGSAALKKNPHPPADRSRRRGIILPMPFVSGSRKKNKQLGGPSDSFSRSKSFATPRRSTTNESCCTEEGGGEEEEEEQQQQQEEEEEDGGGGGGGPHRKGGSSFWSFLYSSKLHHPPSAGKPPANNLHHCVVKDPNFRPTPAATKDKDVGEEEESSPDETCSSSVDRKVSRSRSVGCGSKNFSGDFLERLSNGFGDCALRRVESHREGKHHHKNGQQQHDGSSSISIKDRIKCSRIFSGSSSSSSSYWVASSVHDSASASRKSVSMGSISNGRSSSRSSSSWSWVLASPMRAFSKPAATAKKEAAAAPSSTKNSTPTLSAIPSLLTVS